MKCLMLMILIISTGDSWNEVKNKMNLYVGHISNWLNLNKLIIYIEKPSMQELEIKKIVYQRNLV